MLDRVHPELSFLMDRTEAFAKRFIMNCRANPQLLIVTGPCGNGKTRLAMGCYRYVCALAVTGWQCGWWSNKVPSCGFYHWSCLSSVKHEDRDGLWRDAIESDFAVLDDVGSETDRFKSGEPIENLRLMLGARDGKSTLITTNIPESQWAAKWGGRVEDRLYRRSEIVTLANVPSYYAP